MKSKQLSSSIKNNYQKYRESNLSSSLQHKKVEFLIVNKLQIDSSTIDLCKSYRKFHQSSKPNAKVLKYNNKK